LQVLDHGTWFDCSTSSPFRFLSSIKNASAFFFTLPQSWYNAYLLFKTGFLSRYKIRYMLELFESLIYCRTLFTPVL
jgi:hypothetical protein